MRNTVQKSMGYSSSTSHIGPHPGLMLGPVARKQVRVLVVVVVMEVRPLVGEHVIRVGWCMGSVPTLYRLILDFPSSPLLHSCLSFMHR